MSDILVVLKHSLVNLKRILHVHWTKFILPLFILLTFWPPIMLYTFFLVDKSVVTYSCRTSIQ